MMSRGGKDIPKFDHLREEIKILLTAVKERGRNTDGFHLDGEIFKPGLSLQKISGAARREDKEKGADLDTIMEYHIYDCFNLSHRDWKAEERIFFIKNIIDYCDLKYIKWVDTKKVVSEKDAFKYYDEWVKQGYEGIMFRNVDSVYTLAHRSENLQKLKPFQDEEFEIVGAHEGTGNDVGTVVWDCKTKEGVVFGVKPEGERAERREYWENYKQYIGKMLTVRFQEYSDDKVPIFPVGVAIRDYE